MVDTQTAVLDTVKTNSEKSQAENSYKANLPKQKESLRKNETEYEHKPIKSTIIIRNLNTNVTSADIYELFGLNTTAYLRKNCNVSIPLNNMTKELLGYAYLTIPKHIRNEIIKLNGLNFRGQKIIVENLVTKSFRTTPTK